MPEAPAPRRSPSADMKNFFRLARHRPGRGRRVRGCNEVDEQDARGQHQDHRDHLREHRVREARRRGGQGRRGAGASRWSPSPASPPGATNLNSESPDPQGQATPTPSSAPPRRRLLAHGPHREADGLSGPKPPSITAPVIRTRSSPSSLALTPTTSWAPPPTRPSWHA